MDYGDVGHCAGVVVDSVDHAGGFEEVMSDLRYIVASPEKVRLLHFGGGFRLVRDVAKEADARAAINFGFFSMSANHPKDSYPVGQAIINSKNEVLSPKGIEHFHAVYKRGGKVSIWQWLPADCDWGIRAGPRLIESGQICERSIADSAWVSGGINPATARSRVGIGIRADNQVVLAYWDAATIRQAAQDMLNLGCVEAVAGDGGGSASWYDSENPGHTVSQRLVPNCFIVEGDSSEQPQPEPKPSPGGEKNMIVCIDPGHGGPDPGAVNPILGLREKDITLEVSKRLAEYLKQAGVRVILTRDKDTDLSPGLDDKEEMRARAKIANDAKADYLVSIHANSFHDQTANGVEVSYWPGSIKGEALAKSILDAMHIAGGLPKRRTFGQTLLIHSYGNMVTVTVEIGFVSNEVDGVLLGVSIPHR